MTKTLDLGNGHVLHWTSHPDNPDNDHRVGGIIEHPCKVFEALPDYDPELMVDPGKCSGSIFFDVPWVAEHYPDRPRWRVDSWDPLTLHPSIRSRSTYRGHQHEHHGWIVNGKWTEENPDDART